MFQDDYLVHINQIEQPGLTEIGRYGKNIVMIDRHAER